LQRTSLYPIQIRFLQLINPPASATHYRGLPLDMPGIRSPEVAFPFRLRYFLTVTSTSGGVINTVVTASLSALSNYGSVATLFDEWRIVSAIIKWKPIGNLVANSLLSDDLGIVIDRDSNAALTTLTGAALYHSGVINPVDRKSLLPYRMSGVPQCTWNPVSTTPEFYVKLYASNLSASKNYGYLDCAFWIQGRYGIG